MSDYATLPGEVRREHPFFTYEEIKAQPEAVGRALESVAEHGRDALRLLGGARRVFVTGCGTSMYAAEGGAWALRSMSQGSIDARAIQAYDFVHYLPGLRPDDVVIAVSHSGGTHMTGLALERARRSGVESILITGFPEGPASRLARVVLPTGYAEERSWAHTISYTSALVSMIALANTLAVPEERLDLALLPALLTDVLGLEEMTHRLAASTIYNERFGESARIAVVGGGPNAPTAREAVLKLLETSYVSAEAYELEEMLHGPLAAVTPETLVIIIAPGGRTTDRAAQLARTLPELGVVPVVVAGEGNVSRFEGAHCLVIPEVPEAITPVAAVLPLQLFAYFMAVGKGTNPDLIHRDDERYGRARAQYE